MQKILRRGFTLIELLVVIAIISLLSSVVLASLNRARAKARTAKRVSDMRQLQLALELYFDDNDAYPDTGSVWRDCSTGSGGPFIDNYIPGLAPKYIPKLPHDPLEDCNGNFRYGYKSNGADYKLWVPWAIKENCTDGEKLGIVDPVRPCGLSNESWAVFTQGASGW